MVGESYAFFHVHWYKYPLITWLNLITSSGCRQSGDFDIAYLSELDPTWNDSEMSFVLNPEAALFGIHVFSAIYLLCRTSAHERGLGNQKLDVSRTVRLLAPDRKFRFRQRRSAKSSRLQKAASFDATKRLRWAWIQGRQKLRSLEPNNEVSVTNH